MVLTEAFIKKRNLLLLKFMSIIIMGGFLSFLFLTITDSTTDALFIGYFYAISIVLILTIVQKTVIKKLDVFNPIQQWILRSFIYTISVSTAYLLGLIVQSFILEPNVSILEIIGEKFWTSFVSFISSPLDLELSNNLFKEEYRAVLIPFFAVIILIGMVSLIGSYVEMRWRQDKQQQAVNKAELTALKAQIEPHFLFNSLNTIASEIKNAPDKAEQLILKLSDILRYLFDHSSSEMIFIGEEINFLKKYADLIQARFDEKIQISWHYTLKNENIEIPVLLLQPVLENSIRHGWKDNSESLIITIYIQEDESGILFTVKDNGRGIEPGQLGKMPVPGHALANIQERLYLIYKNKKLLNIHSEYGQGTSVSVRIPVRKS